MMTLGSSISLKLHSLTILESLYDRHMFIAQATGVNVTKHFDSLRTFRKDTLECLFLAPWTNTATLEVAVYVFHALMMLLSKTA
jgi:hypothetical protein